MTTGKSSGWPPQDGCLLIAAILACLVLFPAPGFGEEKVADLNRFCRDMFGGNAFGNVDRRDNGLMCTLRMDGGLGLVHQKIKATHVCLAQQNTNKFRREGEKLFCITGQTTTAARSVNLEQHCKKAHGPDAFLTKRRTDNKPMCTLRTDGGLGLRHHVIDTSALCGGSSARAEGNTLRCGDGSATRASDYPSTKKRKITRADVDRLLNRKFPPLKPEDIIDTGGTGELFNKDVKFANLKDCGNGDPKTRPWSLDDIGKIHFDPKGLDGVGWPYMGVSTPCPGLVGGRIADFLDVCRRGGSTPDWVVEVRRSGRPICWDSSGFPSQDEETLDTHLGLSGAALSGVCSRAYFNSFGRAWKEEERAIWRDLIALAKYRIREKKVECFYMKRCRLNEIWKIGEPCKGPELKLTRIYEKGGAYEEIEGDFRYYGGPVFLELEFENEQEEDSFYATLEWDDAETGTKGRSEILLSRTPEDATLYRSDRINIEPWTPLADGARAILSPGSQQPVVTP